MFSPILESGSGRLEMASFQALLDQRLPKRGQPSPPMAPSFLCGKKKRRIPEAFATTGLPTAKRVKISESEVFETPSTVASETHSKLCSNETVLEPEYQTGSDLNAMNLGPSKVWLQNSRELK